MKKEMNERIPERSEIPAEHQWTLDRLFHHDAAWDEALEKLKTMVPGIERFRGTLHESAAVLRSCFDYMNEVELLDERLGYYAHLRYAEDSGSGKNQERWARYLQTASRVQAAASYQTPEIQSIPDDLIKQFLSDPLVKPFIIPLEKILRFKPHVLSAAEERLLALQAEANQTAEKAFSALTDVDMDFGTIDTPEGKRPLSQSTWSSFLLRPEREIRKAAYDRYYSVFETHKNTLAALYSGSVQIDKYRAEIRDYPSARAAALFPDRVPGEVYDNLIASVSANLDSLHRYYEIKRKALGVDRLMHYDVYVPVVKDIRVTHTYEEAVDVIYDALEPLGDEYRSTLKAGLLGGWVDRYENKGKRSGAFSAGSYAGDPYILMNYKDDVLRDVFTLAHEGGHSMHSYYSAKSNPFQHYNYTIFEAEVASTLNEQLLAKYLLDRTRDKSMRAYLIGKQTDDVVATIFRQTMFAEFEDRTHKMLEAGTPLTVDSLRTTYRELLVKYFGPEVGLEETSDLEGLRIPHFYRAFYVYKYATGLSAAISLAKHVMQGDAERTKAYLEFLCSGGSKYPIDSLAAAGVDMSRSEPVDEALASFRTLTGELEELLELD